MRKAGLFPICSTSQESAVLACKCTDAHWLAHLHCLNRNDAETSVAHAVPRKEYSKIVTAEKNQFRRSAPRNLSATLGGLARRSEVTAGCLAT